MQVLLYSYEYSFPKHSIALLDTFFIVARYFGKNSFTSDLLKELSLRQVVPIVQIYEWDRSLDDNADKHSLFCSSVVSRIDI